MNYLHAYHAGNFADVFKHAIVLALLDALTAKDKPLCYFDTHAGRGSYRLDDTEARKTGEWRDGIGRVWNAQMTDPCLQRYLDAIRSLNANGDLQTYPGSPLLATRATRTGDRLVLCETQDSEVAALRRLLGNDRRVHVHQRDGYAALNALLPPDERRGLILIDPPFEAQEKEFATITTALAKAHARWSTGTYAVWYPIKSRRTVMPFHRQLAKGLFDKVLVAELLLQADDSPLRLNGCGMAIVNPPWKLDATLASLLPTMQRALAKSPRASHTLVWLRDG